MNLAFDNFQFAVAGISFLQWLLIPAVVLLAQNLLRQALGKQWIVVDLLVIIAAMTLIILLPLEFFVGLPLGDAYYTYKYAAILGGVLSVPLTKYLRKWEKTKRHLS